VVFGVGREDAEVLFIGEGPGEQEDLQGEPFVGRAGKLLDDMLSIIDLDRSMIYIANMVKCRPPKNRDPSQEEQAACLEYLREQTRIINPKMIVCLGRISAYRIISPDFKITRDHGVFYERKGKILTAVYHPSALLRDPKKKDDMLADMMKIKAKADELAGI
jgi:DNA polymerase